MPIPPGWDRSYTESLGYTMEDLYEEGARANEARLRAIGLPLDEIAHFPFPMDVTPRERGLQALALLRAGLLGEGDGGPVGRDPETVRIFFDLLARNVRGEEVAARHDDPVGLPRPDPWYLLIEGRREARHPGPRRQADRAPEDALGRLRRARLRARAALPADAARAHAPVGRSARAAEAAAPVSLTAGNVRRSMLRQGPISHFLHGAIEYVAAILLIAAPFLFGFDSSAATALAVVAGVIVLVLAASTDGPTSLINSVPVATHVVLDFVLAGVLIAVAVPVRLQRRDGADGRSSSCSASCICSSRSGRASSRPTSRRPPG